MQLASLTIAQARDLLDRREISSVELTRSQLNRIAQLDPRIQAYLTVSATTALEQAQAADRALYQGQGTSLTGIPLAIKDVICTKDVRTTCGSRILENFIPPYDATVIQHLKSQHAVLLGKLNMDEFAMGSTTEHSAFHVTRNPWDLACTPGGSSGGSAAAVAADMCLGALGSDTGGSIRQPASHCSVVGLKPTYGRVSRYGLVAFASSLDQIGPMTKTVEDCAVMLQAVAGHDCADATSIRDQVPDYNQALSQDVKGLTIGVPYAYFDMPGLDPDVQAAVLKAVETLKALGAQIVEIDLPHTEYGVAAYYILAPSEASSNLARYDGVKFGQRNASAGELLEMYRTTRSQGFGPEVQRRILLGTYCLSAGYYDAYYRKASQVRTLIGRDFSNAFTRCRVIAAPVTPTPAPRLKAAQEDPLAMYLADIFTLSANLAGLPAISIPCGFSANGLPIGLQLIAGPYQEEILLTTAHQFEQVTTFHHHKPSLEIDS